MITHTRTALALAVVLAASAFLAGCPDSAPKQGPSPTSTTSAASSAAAPTPAKSATGGSGW